MLTADLPIGSQKIPPQQFHLQPVVVEVIRNPTLRTLDLHVVLHQPGSARRRIFSNSLDVHYSNSPRSVLRNRNRKQTGRAGTEQQLSSCNCAMRPADYARLVLEAPRSSLHTVAPDLLPHPFDDAGIVVAVPEVVIESRKAVAFTGVFHLFELLLIELRIVDVAPVESRGIHREARSHSAVGSDDHVVLAGSAVPVGEVQLAARVLRDAGRVGQHGGDIAVGASACCCCSHVPALLPTQHSCPSDKRVRRPASRAWRLLTEFRQIHRS